jgi:hypothetical protein
MSGSGMCIYSLLITHYSKAVLKGQGFRPNSLVTHKILSALSVSLWLDKLLFNGRGAENAELRGIFCQKFYPP